MRVARWGISATRQRKRRGEGNAGELIRVKEIRAGQKDLEGGNTLRSKEPRQSYIKVGGTTVLRQRGHMETQKKKTVSRKTSQKHRQNKGRLRDLKKLNLDTIKILIEREKEKWCHSRTPIKAYIAD